VSDLVLEAVGAMWPVLAAGGVATAQGAAEEGGARLLGATGLLLGRIRHRLGADSASRPELEDALREGLVAGEIDQRDLATVVALSRSDGGVHIGEVHAQRVYFGPITLHGGDFHG
jgi:hypothetical protein